VRLTVWTAGLIPLALLSCAPVAGQTQRGRSPERPRQTPAPPSTRAQPGTPAPLYQDTWYDFVVRQFNPDHRNWGDWIEERRQALLDASARNPYFKYSVVSTLLLLMALGAWSKALSDLSRTKCIFEEQLTEALRHDQYSREGAREAIRRYNEHIDKCNRVIEAREAGLPSAGVGNTEVESLRTQLEEARTECDAASRERDNLQAELKQTSATVADLSVRLSRSGNKGNGNGEGAASSSDASSSELMQHINRLQQQLYAEREKNKRLKGG
jgi:hypothetical protein